MFVSTRFFSRAGSLALLLLASVLWSACSYSPGDYCRDLCDCVGCNDIQQDACIDDAEDLHDKAVKAGCGAEADAVFACVGQESTCRAGQYDSDGCEEEIADADACLASSN